MFYHMLGKTDVVSHLPLFHAKWKVDSIGKFRKHDSVS